MNKKLLFLSIPAAMILASCNSSDVDEYTESFTYPTTNLVTNLETGETTASAGTYTFYDNVAEGWTIITSDNLRINGYNYTFKSEETPYSARQYNFETLTGNTCLIIDVPDVFATVNNVYPVINGKFKLANSTYFSNLNIPGLDGYAGYPAVVGEYNINNTWQVKTFANDAFFKGTTTTQFSMGGQEMGFTNTEMLYRVAIDLEKSKATMVMYNAKFAESMPPLQAIIVEGLDVAWSSTGYTITGKNIIPMMMEGSGTTPAPEYTFTSLTIKSVSSDLTSASINYEINFRGMAPYYGYFTGSYVWLPSSNN